MCFPQVQAVFFDKKDKLCQLGSSFTFIDRSIKRDKVSVRSLENVTPPQKGLSMKIWSLIAQKLATREQKAEIHIAILAPRSSGTIETIINLTIHHLKAHTTRTIVVTQFSGITDQAQFTHFLQEAEAMRFDLLFAITGLAAAQARRIYADHGLLIPTLILTYEELLPHPMPNHVSALLLANSAPFAYKLLTSSFPTLKKLIICANPVLFNRVQELADLRSLCSNQGIEIVHIPLPQPRETLASALAIHTLTAQAIFLPVDTEAFSAMPDIIAIARINSCPVFASELHALRYGADLAFGYPLDSIAQECALRLLHLLLYPKREVRFINTVREVHCRSDKQTIMLRALATQQVDYNFKVIGCINNEESEQDQ